MNHMTIKYWDTKLAMHKTKPYHPQWQNTQAPIRDSHVVWQETPHTHVFRPYSSKQINTQELEELIRQCVFTKYNNPAPYSDLHTKLKRLRALKELAYQIAVEFEERMNRLLSQIPD